MIDAFGQGYIQPLQKPGKPKGPLKSLRPLILSNGARKILSVITLNRIQTQVDSYTGPWQAGYKFGRSCSDLVWCQRMLQSIVQQRHWEYYKMDIDMSSAFDTINRQTILNLLTDAGCAKDDIKLVRLLLSNIKLKVKVNNCLSVEFESTEGSPQGDSLSGKLFTLVFAGGLYHLRAVAEVKLSRPNPPFTIEMLPLESAYADDGDFMDEDEDILKQLLPLAKDILSEWNLHINDDKTKFTKFYLANTNEIDEEGNLLRGNESWRMCKMLGSLMSSTEDIANRCNLANIAFTNYNKVWCKKSNITLEKKLVVYEALVISVIMYNSSSWAAPQDVFNKLDAFHRKHLRRILNYKWPHVITNKDLYKRCNAKPLSERIAQSRWRMLGHILRSDENTPAYNALQFAVESAQRLKTRRGRPRITLLSTIKHDLEKRDLNCNTIDDLYYLRSIANDRTKWKKMYF